MRIKVLHIIGGMGRGGAPSFIINNMKKTDRQKIQYDFLVRKDNCAFEDEIKQHGGKIFIVPEFPKHIIKNYRATKLFFKEHKGEYSVVHIHANALLYMLPIKLSVKEWNCKVILHSHNTKSNIKGLSIIHKINRAFRVPKVCIRLACSQSSGRWMYGNSSFEVINNAIDTSKFAYSAEARKKIRDEFEILQDTIVIGNIGRIESAKNHAFMIDVFNEYVRMNENTILILVGEGTLRGSIEEKVEDLGIRDKVIFTGVRSDAYDLYSAFDIFLMPSLFEGLPFTLIEAQAAGLPCLISDNITREVDLTDLIVRIDLQTEKKMWANKINTLIKKYNRMQYAEKIIDVAYDTGVTAKRLEEIYTGNQ